jgi:hypothetical protein
LPGRHHVGHRTFVYHSCFAEKNFTVCSSAPRKSCANTFALKPDSAPNRRPQNAAQTTPPRESFPVALLNLVRRPQQILWLWNWKSAVLSIILRGPIFLIAGARQGWGASLSALFTESVFCAVTAGFYGAVVQTLRNAEPEWLTILFLTTALPALFQILEYSLHHLRGTPHLRLAEIVSLFVSGVSALFNWYAMRRGTLLVGGEGGSFGADLRRLPLLLFNFLVALPRRLTGRSEPPKSETETSETKRPGSGKSESSQSKFLRATVLSHPQDRNRIFQ